MKAYIRLKQHKNGIQNIKQIEPQQMYRLGTISNIKLLGEGAYTGLQASGLALIYCSGLQHLVSCSVLVVKL